MKEITVPATLDQLDGVMEFVRGQLKGYDCSVKQMMQIEIAVEEIYVNIANYAYEPESGDAVIRCGISEGPLRIIIQFLDGGRPYNPLKKEDPDITLGAEDRQIGGLGIYMAKKSMDGIEYSYKDGKNILTISKRLS